MKADIKAIIAFYEARGWDWSSVVCFIAMRAEGLWPTPIQRRSFRSGRKLKSV
jgi:hypothetical protein